MRTPPSGHHRHRHRHHALTLSRSVCMLRARRILRCIPARLCSILSQEALIFLRTLSLCSFRANPKARTRYIQCWRGESVVTRWIYVKRLIAMLLLKLPPALMQPFGYRTNQHNPMDIMEDWRMVKSTLVLMEHLRTLDNWCTIFPALQ